MKAGNKRLSTFKIFVIQLKQNCNKKNKFMLFPFMREVTTSELKASKRAVKDRRLP